MRAKTPTDYERAYHLARKLAYKRLKRIKDLEKYLERLSEEYASIPIDIDMKELKKLMGKK